MAQDHFEAFLSVKVVLRTRDEPHTDEGLEEVALEDVDDPLDGYAQLPLVGVLQFGSVFLQQGQRALGIWHRKAKLSKTFFLVIYSSFLQGSDVPSNALCGLFFIHGPCIKYEGILPYLTF